MVALGGIDQMKVRWHLGYTTQSPSNDWIRLERGMNNILDNDTLSRIVDQIFRCETLWNLIFNPVEELYEETQVTGYYLETIDYKRLPDHAQLVKRFNFECDRLAQSLGARNLRTADNLIAPLSSENLPFLPGLQGIQGSQGIQGLKGDKGDRGNVGLPSRSTATLTVAIAQGETIISSLNIEKTFILQSAQTTNAAWVRVYDSVVAQVSDNGRSPLRDPIAGAGVCAEFTTIVGELVVNFSPPAVVTSRTGITNVPITITNNSLAGSITIDLIYLELEAP